MQTSGRSLSRPVVAFAILLALMSSMAAVHALMASNVWQGFLDLLVLATVLFLMSRTAIHAKLAASDVAKSGLLVMALAAAAVVVYEALTLTSTDAHLLGDVHMPSVILIVRSIGCIALAGYVIIQILLAMRAASAGRRSRSRAKRTMGGLAHWPADPRCRVVLRSAPSSVQICGVEYGVRLTVLQALTTAMHGDVTAWPRSREGDPANQRLL